MAPPCGFFLQSLWQPGCQPPGADVAAWNSSPRLLINFQSSLEWARGVRDTGGCSGKSWNAIVEPHLGRGRRRGTRCWAGRAQLSHSSGSQKALLGALSLFRQEMSADSGLWDAVAGWLTGRQGGIGVHALSQLSGFSGAGSPIRPRSPGWAVQPLGRKIIL